MKPEGSQKDFDVFLYPRKKACLDNAQNIIEAIRSMGWTLYTTNIPDVPNQTTGFLTSSSSPNKPYAYFETPKGYRVDLFFMSCLNMKTMNDIKNPYKTGYDDNTPF